jgi:hypothetical protein
MQDEVIQDLIIYEAIKILIREVKLNKHEEDDKILSEYYGKVKVKIYER